MTAPLDRRNKEPECWWTERDIKRFTETLIVTGPHKGWFGRWYMIYTSPPHGNIYRERFTWKEPCARP